MRRSSAPAPAVRMGVEIDELLRIIAEARRLDAVLFAYLVARIAILLDLIDHHLVKPKRSVTGVGPNRTPRSETMTARGPFAHRL